jgi:hypothetical protein
MGAVVARWSGLEARALREATRMSVGTFTSTVGLVAVVSPAGPARALRGG